MIARFRCGGIWIVGLGMILGKLADDQGPAGTGGELGGRSITCRGTWCTRARAKSAMIALA